MLYVPPRQSICDFIVHLEATFSVWTMTIDVSFDLESLPLFTRMSKEMFLWILVEILNHTVDKIDPAPPGIHKTKNKMGSSRP